MWLSNNQVPSIIFINTLQRGWSQALHAEAHSIILDMCMFVPIYEVPVSLLEYISWYSDNVLCRGSRRISTLIVER
jgi:hypothetical protein